MQKQMQLLELNQEASSVKINSLLSYGKKAIMGGKNYRKQELKGEITAEKAQNEIAKARNEIVKALKEYEIVLLGARTAISKILEGKLTCFDALVGETACQIRALKVALIYKQVIGPEGIEKRTRLEKLKETIESVQSSIKSLDLEAVVDNGLDIEKKWPVLCEKDDLYLIQSFILSQGKKLYNIIPKEFEGKENSNARTTK